MDETYANIGYVSKTQKRAIVRGLQFPNIGGQDYKERPGLIISDITECPGMFNGINIIAVPLTSLPYTDFDIPVFTELTSGKRKVSYISASNQFQFLFNEKLIWTIQNCSVCPDRVFNLVMKVKKLLLKARKKDYLKAKELVKEYRLEFMKAHGISMIHYSIDIDKDYILNVDGTEEVIEAKGVTRVTIPESQVVSLIPDVNDNTNPVSECDENVSIQETTTENDDFEKNDREPETVEIINEEIEEVDPTIVENIDDEFLSHAFIFTGFGANYVSVNDFIMIYKYYCEYLQSEGREIEISSEKDLENGLWRMYPSVGKRKSRMYTLFNTIFKTPLHGYRGIKWNFEFLKDINYELVKDRVDYVTPENENVGPVSPKSVDMHESTNLRYDSTTGYIYENNDEPESVYEDASNGTFGSAFADAFKKMHKNEVVETPKSKVEEPKVEKEIVTTKKQKEEKKSKYVKVSKATDAELLNFIKLINNCGTCVEVAIKLDCTSSTVVHRFNQTMKELERRGLSQHIIEWPFKKG